MDALEPHIALLLASFVGAITYPALVDRNVTTRGWVVYGFVGTAIGFIFGPIVCEWRGFDGRYAWSGMGFFLGASGVLICRECFRSAESDTGQLVKQHVANFIRRFFGDGPPPMDKPGQKEPDSDLKL